MPNPIHIAISKHSNLPRKNRLLKSKVMCLCFSFLSFVFTASISNAQQQNKITPIINFLLFSDTAPGQQTSLEDASRFLIQSTFGPSYDDIAKLSNSSIESWINQQFRLRKL